MVFNASNLPPLPAGRTYQLWVVTAQAPISAGFLTPDARGSVSEVFNTPPDIPQPVAMAVTIEPAGGMPAPTGEKYLVGRCRGQSYRLIRMLVVDCRRHIVREMIVLRGSPGFQSCHGALE